MHTLTWRVNELAARRLRSARRLAEATGLDQKTVRNILAGRATRVDLETIARLSDALAAGCGLMVSTDRGFDRVDGLRRLGPGCTDRPVPRRPAPRPIPGSAASR